MKPGLVLLCLFVCGCSFVVELTPAGKQVHLLTSGEEAAKCQQITVITEYERHHLSVGNAIKDALNDTAAAGGNAFYLVEDEATGLHGSSVVGDALKCPQFPPVQ